MIGTDTGLRFWLRYVEARGGLSELRGDSALVVLPPGLQTMLGLPDELVVTGDPDVAREDGATFLAAGHPVLGQSAGDVLADGDVARVAVPVPATPPPSVSVLVERARDQFPVDHGRIDAAGALTRTVRPVLRVGALVSYTVSTEDHYQERVECFLDAFSRLELPEPMSTKLVTLPRTRAEGRVDLSKVTAAIGQAHRIIDARAEERRTSLSGQAGKALAVELERAEAYYRDMLATIARRLENAPAERRELLAARGQSVREERARRLAEVREKYQPAHEIKPYRLHVFELPVWRLPVDVRRGDRRYPLTLDWLVPLSQFAGIRCPHCEAVEQLVAGKTRLGCAGCLTKSLVQAVPASGVPASGAPAPKPANAPKPGKPAESKAERPTTPPPRATVPPPTSAAAPSLFSPEKTVKAGDKLTRKLWDALASGDRRSSRLCSPDSPAAAAARLFGPSWPAVAIGIPTTEILTATTSRTEPAEPMAPQPTCGAVETASGRRFPFLLWWRMVNGTPLIDEILPFDGGPIDPAVLPLWMLGPGWHATLTPPPPQISLGPIEKLLWRRGVPRHGLSVVLRCLAAWWRLPDQATLTASHTPAALAAALERSICSRSGRRGGRYAEAASAYRVDENAVRGAGTDLQAKLQLSRAKSW